MYQLDLFSTVPSEAWVFDEIKPRLLDVLQRNNVDQCRLTLKKGKNYSSVWFDTQMAFRICCRENHQYFGISESNTDCVTSELAAAKTTAGRSEGFANYSFVPTEEGIALCLNTLCNVLDKTIDSLPKEFDCCGRYNECSDAKRCIHPNSVFATGCGYRKILKSGRIFYGKNRNVD